MTEATSSFHGRVPPEQQLDDLILIALALREQANLDERMTRRTKARRSHEFTGNVCKVAEAEGWQVTDNTVDAAVSRLASKHLLMTDRDPTRPEPSGCKARLSANGYARAAKVSRTYLGTPLQGFERDDKIFEGMGQILVEFLDQRYVLGCVEGEEDRAILNAHRFEVDTGEVLKAVPGDLDHKRAILMAGILAYERIEELESGTNIIPASDRVVGLNHNSPDYIRAVDAIDSVIKAVRESNTYRDSEPEDRERRLAELEAGRRLLNSRWVSLATVKAALWGTLTYLVAKFADAPIGETAGLAWAAMKKVLGLPF